MAYDRQEVVVGHPVRLTFIIFSKKIKFRKNIIRLIVPHFGYPILHPLAPLGKKNRSIIMSTFESI